MSLKCGIVGLPNVGKSTLFNALSSSSQAESANYPFCTIDPNVGRVPLPDRRLNELASVAGSAQVVPAHVEFVDIAGLVKGASRGEGLGNRFLAAIRETDVILHVVRCFDDSDVVHVSGKVNPIDDISVIETELMLADLESVESRLPAAAKRAKNNTSSAEKKEYDALLAVHHALSSGHAARFANFDDPEVLASLQLLTTKPVMYVCNVDEAAAAIGNEYTEMVRDRVGTAPCVAISAALEADVSQLSSPEEKEEFLNVAGIEQSGLDCVVRTAFKLLNLSTYFTAGPKETKAWTISNGMTAPQAAGVIHSDFERGFICAEVINWRDFIEFHGEQGCKQAGKIRLEGRDYIVNDGDVMHFRFNV